MPTNPQKMKGGLRALNRPLELPGANPLKDAHAALKRQLFRAMNQPERLQRRRAGEIIPAPLTMEISAKA